MATSLCVSLAVAAGCDAGGGPGRGSVDPEAAKRLLVEVLDAWKAGGKPEDLARKSPPVTVGEEEWQAGSQLVSYELAPGERAVGSALSCVVELSVKGKDGKAARRRVSYDVTTAPPSVFRRD
ncbi:hypothetical protein [Aquisphaera giovannonii]|uniref:hypothetical protein n=1 Tax=Aquisphaera giovannonii TaxID=406548 RepID=UPI0011DF04A2|nr:hypothetical protein [Aquisphaera giovannonii]